MESISSMQNRENTTESLKKGMALVFIANAISLCISLARGFILPKYLSVESYADLKTYQLYANYIGVLAFGYADGLYLAYGGKKMTDVGANGINTCRTNLCLFQGLVTVISAAASLLIGDNILLLTAISILPVNAAAAYKNIFQATGEFQSYSKILNYTSILSFLGMIVLLFFVKTDDSICYIGWNVAVTFIIWLLMERKMAVEYRNSFHWSPSRTDLIANIKAGIVLMLGNFSSILMTSIDRWFVKGLLTTVDFAYYSFAVSVENLIAIFITPVVTTMYNFICVTTDMSAIRRIKRMCLVLSLFLISSAFPAKFILEVYLQKYLPAAYILFILFATEVFYMVIKGIYVNIYKARKSQATYLKQLLLVIAVGVILNAAAYALTRSKEGIAFATLAAVIIWYVICSFSVREVAPDWKENLLVISLISLFIATGFYLPAMAGFAIYMVGAGGLSFILMRDSLAAVWNMGTNMIGKKLRR